MPGFHSEIGILTIGDGLPPGFENRRKRLFREVVIDGIDRDAIDTGTDGGTRIDGVDGSSSVDAHALSNAGRSGKQKKSEDGVPRGDRHELSQLRPDEC
jgi:hypothetical protein